MGSSTTTKTYLWGMDLSGTMQGAGGVGGLLKSSDGIFTYDANGNVSELLDATGSVVAHYEYDSFGNELTGTTGSNRFQFSTKYFDEETELSYYGFRYYNANDGRWPNRDPIGEFGGLNLYAFVGNHPVGRVDILGLATDCGCDDQGNKINPVTDDTGAECCPDEISTVTLNVDHGTIGHAWLNTPDGSYGHYPASPVPRLQGATEWATGTGTARPGDTKSPDPHQTAHDQNNTNPDASSSYNYCPGSYQKQHRQ